MIQTLAILRAEGFPSVITQEFTPENTEIIRFRGDFDIDDDGANGQHGLPIAYQVDNRGRERLADMGYPLHPDEYSQGLICFPGTRTLKVFTNAGVAYYASRTALRMPGFANDDPRVGVDAEFFPYIVVPPVVQRRARGIVLGCHCSVVNHRNGRTWDAVVADIGPSAKDGEGSPELARRLGIPDSPLSGGVEAPDIEYILYPGRAALVTAQDGSTFLFRLQAAA